MDIQLADQAYVQGADGGAEIICKNMYPVRSPSYDGRGFELLSCAGLNEFTSVTGNVRGLIAQDGLFNGDIFLVEDSNVCRVTSTGVKTIIGTVPLTGDVTMAASRIELAICVAPNLYTCDGTTITQVTDVDLPTSVTSVAYINQRFAITNDEDRLYWSALLDGSSWDGLNFLTAESSPDALVRVVSDGERLYAMGTTTTEHIGAVTNPSSASGAFARVGSGVIKSGLAGKHAVAIDVDSKAMGFVGHNRIVYVTTGYEVQEISTPFINAELDKASDANIAATRCFAYSEQGDTFFIVNVPSIGTFAYSKKLNKWHMRDTLSETNWRAELHVLAWGKNYVADTGSRKIWEMSRDILTDDGLEISKEFSGFIPVRQNGSFGELVLDAFASDDCKVGMRFSDNGREWSSYVDRDVTSPDMDCVTVWRRLGKSTPPKRVFWFRITDEAKIVVRGLRVNDGQLR